MKLLAAFLLLLLSLSAIAADSGIAALLTEGHLDIRSSIHPGEGAVPGQKLTLTLQIATDTWFTGGTRIGIPEIPGLVILQSEQFAANSSETRGGQTWVVQRWTLDVYPQREGEFTIEAIPLQLKVSGGSADNLEGEILAPPVHFYTTVPEALQQADFWVAAPMFTVDQSFDRPLEGLVPGDAIERRIRFESSDIMAMMLPPFEEEELPGLAAYPAPPTLENSSNRGEMQASREQIISYVVEAPGRFLLPAQDYFWWNTNSGELEVVSLPATEILVGGSAKTAAEKTAQGLPIRLLAVLAGALALCALLAWLLLRYRPWITAADQLEPLLRLWAHCKSLRRPALPSRLNPGSQPRK